MATPAPWGHIRLRLALLGVPVAERRRVKIKANFFYHTHPKTCNVA